MLCVVGGFQDTAPGTPFAMTSVSPFTQWSVVTLDAGAVGGNGYSLPFAQNSGQLYDVGGYTQAWASRSSAAWPAPVRLFGWKENSKPLQCAILVLAARCRSMVAARKKVPVVLLVLRRDTMNSASSLARRL